MRGTNNTHESTIKVNQTNGSPLLRDIQIDINERVSDLSKKINNEHRFYPVLYIDGDQTPLNGDDKLRDLLGPSETNMVILAHNTELSLNLDWCKESNNQEKIKQSPFKVQFLQDLYIKYYGKLNEVNEITSTIIDNESTISNCIRLLHFSRRELALKNIEFQFEFCKEISMDDIEHELVAKTYPELKDELITEVITDSNKRHTLTVNYLERKVPITCHTDTEAEIYISDVNKANKEFDIIQYLTRANFRELRNNPEFIRDAMKVNPRAIELATNECKERLKRAREDRYSQTSGHSIFYTAGGSGTVGTTSAPAPN